MSFREIKCLKCAGENTTKNCKNSSDPPTKCVNCGGAHPASSTACEFYQRRIASLGSNKQKQKYMDAATTTENAWTKREKI